MQPTIRDVARLAGVAVSTVSRVCNHSGYVHRETEKKVLQAMKDLDFNLNSIARSLASGRTSTVGLLIPDVANPYFADVARGTEDAAIRKGFSVILCNSDWQRDREMMYLRLLRSRWVDGIIVVGSRSSEETLKAELSEIPSVLVDRQASQILCDSVWMDNEKGARLATDHLRELGCRSIAHIRGPIKSPSASARLRGFRIAIQDMDPACVLIAKGDYRYQSGHDAGSHLLTLDAPPDGVFAGNDLMAFGFAQAAAHLGVRIPDDVKLVGYDNIAMAAFVSPPLTSIDQPSYEMGSAAFDMLYDRLYTDHDRLISSTREFEPELIIRESTVHGA